MSEIIHLFELKMTNRNITVKVNIKLNPWLKRSCFHAQTVDKFKYHSLTSGFYLLCICVCVSLFVSVEGISQGEDESLVEIHQRFPSLNKRRQPESSQTLLMVSVCAGLWCKGLWLKCLHPSLALHNHPNSKMLQQQPSWTGVEVAVSNQVNAGSQRMRCIAIKCCD